MQQTIPILGPHVQDRSINVNGQETINFYVAPQLPGAKTPIALYSTPGLRTKNTAGNGACRSNFVEFGGKGYAVFGNKFVSVDTSYIVAEIGTLNTSSGRCTIVSGRNYIVVVDGSDGWHYNGTTFAQISSGNFPSNCTHIAYMDGYFLANDSTTDQWAISSNEDPTTWGATDVANAEKRQDNITCIATSQSQVYLIGPITCEVHANTGNADFPFQRYPNGVLDYGIRSPYSAARCKLGVVYYSATEEGAGQIVLVNGIQAQVISQDSLQWELKDLSDGTDAYAFCYMQAGKTFYQITFPQADKTFCIDVENGNWFRKKSLNTGRHRVSGHGYINGQNMCGDYSNNNVYKLDLEYFKDGNDLINRERKTQVIHSNRNKLRITRIEIETEAGTHSDPTADPQLLLRYSKDGGKSWSNWISRSMGTRGSYKTRTIFRLGIVGRDIVFHFMCSADMEVNIVGGYAQVEELRS